MTSAFYLPESSVPPSEFYILNSEFSPNRSSRSVYEDCHCPRLL